MPRLRYPFLAGCLVAAAINAHAQGIGIGTTNPDPAAVLDVQAADKGLLIPRLDSAQRVAIPNPPDGLMVFQKNGRRGLWYCFGGGWLFIPDKVRAGDNLGNHTATQNLNLNGHQLTGGGSTGVAVGSTGNVGIGTAPATGVRLDVAGTTRTTSLESGTLKVTGGAGIGKVLTSDAAGTATWQSAVAGPAGPSGPAGAVGLYGDGSAGALNITTSMDLNALPTGYNHQFTTITVAAGATLTVPSGTILRCTGNATISGQIEVGTFSQQTTLATGANNYNNLFPAPGIALTPAGGTSIVVPGEGLLAGTAATLPLRSLGGGAGLQPGGSREGGGGGSFTLLAQGTLTITGGITATGARGTTFPGTSGSYGTGGGGGGGGVLTLVGKAGIINNGVVSVKGGAGGDGAFNTNFPTCNIVCGGGGGGGGVLRLLGASVSGSGQALVSGGDGGMCSQCFPPVPPGSSSFGYGGGGSGGSGGNGNIATFGPSGPRVNNGALGHLFTITTPSPENLLLL